MPISHTDTDRYLNCLPDNVVITIHTSSGVLPSTSFAIFSISSRPYFSFALINWLKSRLVQFVKPEILFHLIFMPVSDVTKDCSSKIYVCFLLGLEIKYLPWVKSCSFSCISSSVRASASSILRCSSLWILAASGPSSGLRGTLYLVN